MTGLYSSATLFIFVFLFSLLKSEYKVTKQDQSLICIYFAKIGTSIERSKKQSQGHNQDFHDHISGSELHEKRCFMTQLET